MANSVTLKGKKLTIVLDVDTDGTPSSTGKTLLHAGLNGKQEIQIDGKQVSISCNVFTKA